MKKTLLAVLSGIAGAAVGAGTIGKAAKQKLRHSKEMSDKHLSLYLMMNQWVRMKQEGKNLSACFIERGYHDIAVYGMSYAGETLFEELKGTEVHVAYAIDQNADEIDTDVRVITPAEPLEPVDAIVVTAVTYYEEIKAKLKERTDCPILSLEEIIHELQ